MKYVAPKNPSPATADPELLHLNPARWIVAATFVITYIVAALFRSPLLFLMASTCVAVTVLALIVRRAGLSSLQYDLSVPPRVTEGEEVDWSLVLTHSGRLPLFSIRARMEFGDWVQPVERTAVAAMGIETHNIGWFTGVILPGERIEFSGRLKFELRGERRVGAVTFSCEDALGLFQVRSRLDLDAETLVLPRRIPLRQVGLSMPGYSGAHLSRGAPVLAEAGEFHGTREYVPGDPLRRINWKWTARLNEFRVVEFQEEISSSLAVLLDLDRKVHAGDGKESTVEYAVRIVASLAEHLALRGQSVDVFFQDGDAFARFQLADRRTLDRFLDRLATVEAASELTLDDLVQRWSRNRHPDSPTLIVSPAPAHYIDDALRALARSGCPGGAFWLDVDSFVHSRSERPSEPASTPPPPRPPAGWKTFRIRKGDDLRAALESVP